ncbi:MAG: hypothetical protein AAFP13_04180 [Pseudomonadota bacterium]
MARAIQAGTIVRVRFAMKTEQLIHPVRLDKTATGWRVLDGFTESDLPMESWGRLNVSAKRIPKVTEARGL